MRYSGQNYDPFNKPFEEINAEDLAILKDIEEGLFVEYKSDKISSKNYAKSLSAFANTYGGWLFIGIKEKSKASPAADEFIGVSSDSASAEAEKIRAAISSHLSHGLVYFLKILNGPCDVIGLSGEKSIIIAYVPQSIHAPHVHKSGHIYRRVSDSSDPSPESDRIIIEQMFKRSEDYRNHFKNWIEKDLEFSDGETSLPYIRILLEPDRSWMRNPALKLNEEEIFKRVTAKYDLFTSVSFDNTSHIPYGFVFRSVAGNDIDRMGLTFIIRDDLSAEIIIPVNRLDNLSLGELNQKFSLYNYFKQFYQRDIGIANSHAKIADLNTTYIAIFGVLRHYNYILDKSKWHSPYSFKVQGINLWRSIPFIDTQSFNNWVSSRGVPMAIRSNALSPPDTTPDSFEDISSGTAIKDDGVDTVEGLALIRVQSARIFSNVMLLFGLPNPWLIGAQSGVTWDHEILHAAHRAAGIPLPEAK